MVVSSKGTVSKRQRYVNGTIVFLYLGTLVQFTCCNAFLTSKTSSGRLRKPMNHTLDSLETILSSSQARNLTAEKDRDNWGEETIPITTRKVQSTDSEATTKLIVILLELVEGRTLHAREDYDAIFNGEGISDDLYPSGSIKTYLYDNSYGKVSLDAYVHDWVKSPKSEAECAGPNGEQGQWEGYAECVYPALEELDAKHNDPDDPFNWEDYSTLIDGVHVVENIAILHNGYNAESETIDPDGTFPSERIYSHVRNMEWQSLSTGTKIKQYVTVSAYRGNQNENFMRFNLFLHYYLQALGALPLFDIDFLGYGVGAFDILAFPTGWSNKATDPGNVGAYSKIRLGWVDPIEITTSGTYSIAPSFSTEQIYKLSYGYEPMEFLLIENKQPLGWDSDVPGGIVIWYIDDSKTQNDQSQTRAAIIQADGLFELEAKTSWGDSEDFWYAGGAKDELSDFGTPNLKSRASGLETGVRIFDFSARGGPETPMTFSIEGLVGSVPSQPVATSPPTADPILIPVTDQPTSSPTEGKNIDPTLSPSASPVDNPTKEPTQLPTAAPVTLPDVPTLTPVASPTPNDDPTLAPTLTQTVEPTISSPSQSPGSNPEPGEPTIRPTSSPDESPSAPTLAPNLDSTSAPGTSPPVSEPATGTPSLAPAPFMDPTVAPHTPTDQPTRIPTIAPSLDETPAPSKAPTTPVPIFVIGPGIPLTTAPIAPVTPRPTNPPPSASSSPQAESTPNPLPSAPVDETRSPSSSTTSVPIDGPTSPPPSSVPGGESPSPVQSNSPAGTSSPMEEVSGAPIDVPSSGAPVDTPGTPTNGGTNNPGQPTSNGSETSNPSLSLAPAEAPAGAPVQSPGGSSPSPAPNANAPTEAPPNTPVQNPGSPSLSSAPNAMETTAPALSATSPPSTENQCLSAVPADNCTAMVGEIILVDSDDDCPCLYFCDGEYLGCCSGGVDSCSTDCTDFRSCPNTLSESTGVPSVAPIGEQNDSPTLEPTSSTTTLPSLSPGETSQQLQVKPKDSSWKKPYAITQATLGVLLLAALGTLGYFSYVRFYY